MSEEGTAESGDADTDTRVPRAAGARTPLGETVGMAIGPSDNSVVKSLAFAAQADPQTLVVALLRVVGGSGFGNTASLMLRRALTEVLLPDSGTAKRSDAVPTASAFNAPEEWVSWSLRRARLPTQLLPMAVALGNHLGHICKELGARLFGMTAYGLICVVRGRRAALVRRGICRVCLLRDGVLRPVVLEDVMGLDPGMLSDPALADHRTANHWVMLSMFTPVDPPDAQALELELRDGDRLSFAASEALLEALAKPELEHLLAEATADLAISLPKTPELLSSGWAVVSLHIGPEGETPPEAGGLPLWLCA